MDGREERERERPDIASGNTKYVPKGTPRCQQSVLILTLLT